METATTKTTQVGQSAFVPIPDLEKMAVGHIGLYPVDDDDTDNDAVSVIVNDIPLGIKGGKTLIDCEKGIKAFVKDVLVADKNNNLPNTETGVWVHYLTQGIIRDYGRTWENTPISLQERRTKLERDIAKGKRVLSKKEKNELIAKTTWDFWSNEVSVGNISMEQAFVNMKEAIDKVEELKNQGLYLSPNKTEGVKSFDWKTIVEETCKSQEATKVYTRNKIEIVIPNIMETVYNTGAKKLKRGMVNDLLKSELFGTVLDIADKSGIKKYGIYDADAPDKGGLENTEIKTIDDLIKFYEVSIGRDGDMKELKNAYQINSVHLVKMKQPGMMKPRWVCWDLTNKKTNERQLWLMDRGSARMTIKS